MTEYVDHPKHYNSHPSGMECIDLIRNLPFSLGNAVKYTWRLGLKDGHSQELEKALWYLADAERNPQKLYIPLKFSHVVKRFFGKPFDLLVMEEHAETFDNFKKLIESEKDEGIALYYRSITKIMKNPNDKIAYAQAKVYLLLMLGKLRACEGSREE